MNKTTFIKNLYKAVDDKNLEDLSELLSDNVRFCIANHDPINGKETALKANQAFFSSITSMKHHIDTVWEQDSDVICNGSVDYIRLDGSEFSAPFATVLKLQADKIADYLVYADISQL
jgi:ketosteroid isomerase-like protein